MGYVIYRISDDYFSSEKKRGIWYFPRNFLIIGSLSLLADLDSVVGIVSGQFGRYHNNLTHSLIFGLLAALMSAIVLGWGQQSSFFQWLMVAFLAYESHVFLDYLTFGRGVMLFWPFSTARFGSPIKIFYGLHWSEGWTSVRHVWTFVTEIVFFLLLYILYNLFYRLRHKFTRWMTDDSD